MSIVATASPPETDVLEGDSQAGVLFAMCLSLVLVVASVSSLNLATPELAVDLEASSSALTWIADGYTLALAALVLPLGALGDRFGRRNILLLGTVLFGVAAGVGAFANSTTMLIGARAAMGVGAAMIMPGTLSTITAVFPPDKRGKAVATWSAFASAGAIVGLLAAGVLLEVWGWQSTFVLTAGLAVLSFVGALFLTPNTADEEHRPLDLVGSLLSAVGIGGLVFGIIEGSERGWTDPLAVAGYGATAVGLAGYVFRDLRTDTPLLDPRLFRQRGFSSGALTIVAQFLAMFGFVYVGLQFLLLVLGYSPLESALALMPLGAAVLLVAQLTPHLVAHLGLRAVMASGLAALCAGMVVLARLDEGSSYWAFLVGALILGAGMSLASTPATSAIVESLPRSKQGVASGVNDTSREVGAALGVALMVSFYNSGYADSISGAASGLPPEGAAVVAESPAAGLEAARLIGGDAGDALAGSVRAAFMDGFSQSLTVGAGVVAVAVAFVIWRGPRLSIVASEEGPPANARRASTPSEPPDAARTSEQLAKTPT